MTDVTSDASRSEMVPLPWAVITLSLLSYWSEMSHNKVGAKKRRKGREDGVDSHRFQPEISLDEINPSHLWKREFKKENNRKVGGKHDFTEDK